MFTSVTSRVESIDTLMIIALYELIIMSTAWQAYDDPTWHKMIKYVAVVAVIWKYFRCHFNFPEILSYLKQNIPIDDKNVILNIKISWSELSQERNEIDFLVNGEMRFVHRLADNLMRLCRGCC